MHPTERELAQRLAEESEGRYTVEQIEEQLRLSNITDTAINPSTDMLVGSPEGIYDTGGRWIEVGDGQYIQVFSTADINPEITGYISEKTSVYDWEMPKPVSSATDGFPDWQRDRLTGYPLDEKGGYRVPVVIDGERYSPRFHSCGTSECLAVGANIDFSDPDTLRWIRAAEVNALDNASTALSAAAVFTPAGPAVALSTMSTISTLVSGYISDESYKAGTAELAGAGFKLYAVNRGVDPLVADRLTNALNATGFFKELVNAHWDSGNE